MIANILISKQMLYVNLKPNLMRKIFTLILITLLAAPGFSQKTVKEWAEADDKAFFKSSLFGDSQHLIKKFADSPDEWPKLEKIGVLGFSMFQPTWGEVKVTNESWKITQHFLTDAGKEYVVDELYTGSYPGIMKYTSQANIQLLMPYEYLDSPEKEKLYEETEFEISTIYKYVEKMQNHVRNSGKSVKGCPDGYKYIGAANADPKLWRAIGKFAGDMELDALLVIETTVQIHKQSEVFLDKITVSVIGPNTVPYDEKDKKKYAPMGPLKGYLEGILYGWLEVTAPKGWLTLMEMDRGKVTATYFEGLDEIYGRIIAETLAQTNAAIEKNSR